MEPGFRVPADFGTSFQPRFRPGRCGRTIVQKSTSSAAAIRARVRMVMLTRPLSTSCQRLYPIEARAAASSCESPAASRSRRMCAAMSRVMGRVPRFPFTAPS